MSDRVVVAPDAWVAPKAILDGEVHIGSGCVIDHGSMIVATGGRIDIGARVVILVSVIAQAYLAGVSARRVERLVQTLGIERLSKSQVSVMAKALDGMVDEFRNRPWTAAHTPTSGSTHSLSAAGTGAGWSTSASRLRPPSTPMG